MARQIRSWNPGDAANAYVRMILSDIGRLVGGLSEAEWDGTLEFFGGRCAYTGRQLTSRDVVREHAVPINRTHCGVHAYGNVLPSSMEANAKKGGMHYVEFMETVVKDVIRLRNIERFVAETGYQERIAAFGDLRQYCDLQYRQILALAEVNKAYLRSFVEDEVAGRDQDHGHPARSLAAGVARSTLRIRLEPVDIQEFKTRLLETKKGWVVTYYSNGTVELRPWDASRMSGDSNVMQNLRSRPLYRNPTWRERGIERVLATVFPAFLVKLGTAYYEKGFFNVPRDADRFIGQTGSLELTLGEGKSIEALVRRNENPNGTARIHGRAALRDWFQANYPREGVVVVRAISPQHLTLG